MDEYPPRPAGVGRGRYSVGVCRTDREETESKQMNSTILSIAASTLGTPPAFQMIAAASRGGFDALGLHMVPPPRWFRSDPDDLTETASTTEIRKRLDDAGLFPLALNAIYMVPETDRSVLESMLDVAAVLGARHYQVVILDHEKERALENFALAAALAKERDVRLALEFKDDSAIQTIGQAGKFIDAACAAPTSGICLDILHLSRSGGTPADIVNSKPGSIFYLELSDAPIGLPDSAQAIREESRRKRLLPGEGGLWIDDVLRALPRDTPIHLECPGTANPGFSLEEHAVRCGRLLREYLEAHL